MMEFLLQNPTALFGVIALVILFLAIFIMDKKENRKNFRHKTEYGSARWGKKQDIEPFVDPIFKQNVILTQTESLTMNSRVLKVKLSYTTTRCLLQIILKKLFRNI